MKYFTLNCKGKPLNINKPLIMGILNVTPDSFFDGSRFNSENEILNRVEKMLNQGASIIDVGGQSTRPGAPLITADEESERVLKPIQLIHKNFPQIILSIDTFRSSVAKAAVEEGASIVNDISAGEEDEAIFEIAANYNCPLIAMHRQGNFKTMHREGNYENILCDVTDHFIKIISKARTYGIKDVIIDSGFGFSKSLEQNYYLLKHLKVFEQLETPLLVGVSRKSMLSKITGGTAETTLNATSIVHMIALQNGANILRTHDVKEAMECIKIYEQLYPESK